MSLKEEWFKIWSDFTNHIRTSEEVYQFITDLRKKDEEELIKIFTPMEWIGDTVMEIADGYNQCISEKKKLIKDYYNK